MVERAMDNECDNLNLFCHRIDQIREYDREGFMRQATLCLNKINFQLKRLPFDDVHRKLDEINSYTQHQSNWNSEIIKNQIKSDFNYIHDLLMAHQQDWES